MNDIPEIIRKELVKQPLVYVTRDLERALGMEEKDGYFVISNEKEEGLDTHELLESKRVKEFMEKNPTARVLVFQNNPRIERLCKEKNWSLLNPSAELSKNVEEKISQVEWLGHLSSLLPPHNILKIKDLKLKIGENKILQFNHAHTGEGTYLIKNDNELSELKEKFPEREARITNFIDGPVFTVNAVVCGNKTLVGNISYQITGLSPFTENPFSTIGNDFALPHKILSEKELEKIKEMAVAVGDRLASSGWKGLFGIDVIQDKDTKKIYLLEINARQPASATFESQLQKQSDPKGLTTFETHILALLEHKTDNSQLTTIKEGGQIVLRNSNHSLIRANRRIDDVVKKLKENGFTVITYENTEPNKELLRIQTRGNIMESHNVLSSEGNSIKGIIEGK